MRCNKTSAPTKRRQTKSHVLQGNSNGGGGIMVWGYFPSQGMVPIHHIDGIMNRFMYRDILQNVMLPSAEDEMPLQWRFQILLTIKYFKIPFNTLIIIYVSICMQNISMFTRAKYFTNVYVCMYILDLNNVKVEAVTIVEI